MKINYLEKKKDKSCSIGNTAYWGVDEYDNAIRREETALERERVEHSKSGARMKIMKSNIKKMRRNKLFLKMSELLGDLK